MLKISQLTGFNAGGSQAIPVFISAPSVSVSENALLAFTVITSEATTIEIFGTDAGKLQVASNALSTTHVLQWLGNTIKDYENPDDSDRNNIYLVTLAASSASGVSATQNFAVTVLNDIDWSDVFASVQAGTNEGFKNYTMRQVLAAGSIAAGGTKVRVVIEPAPFSFSNYGLHINSMYIGEQDTAGDPYDMKASAPAPMQFMFNGSPSISLAKGVGTVTDGLDFPIDKTKGYVITAYFDPTLNTAFRMGTAPPGATGYYKPNANEAAIANVTGYFSYIDDKTTLLISAVQTNILRLIPPGPATFNDDKIPYVSVGGGVAYTDISWLNVKFLTGYEGANGGTTVTDESIYARSTAIRGGTGTVSTDTRKFGVSSYKFIKASYLRWPDSSDWDLSGYVPFTIETHFNALSFSGQQQLIGKRPVGTSGICWWLYLQSNLLAFGVGTTGLDNINVLIGNAFPLSTSTWYHACVDFDGTTYRLYLNGTVIASSTTLYNIFNNNLQLSLGSNSDSTSSTFAFDGYLDETRFTKGVARYKGNFVPPTTAYPRG